MTFEKLEKIITKNKIPKNVLLQSDSGWECCETEMNGIYYNKKENKIIFTQEESKYEYYDKNIDFLGLNGKQDKED